MKKWLIIAGVIVALWVMVMATIHFIRQDDPTEKALKTLTKEVKALRVVAEHRELQWKIRQYEQRLKPVRPAPQPVRQSVVIPVPTDPNAVKK